VAPPAHLQHSKQLEVAEQRQHQLPVAQQPEHHLVTPSHVTRPCTPEEQSTPVHVLVPEQLTPESPDPQLAEALQDAMESQAGTSVMLAPPGAVAQEPPSIKVELTIGGTEPSSVVWANPVADIKTRTKTMLHTLFIPCLLWEVRNYYL
jgi:hypothetical protein